MSREPQRIKTTSDFDEAVEYSIAPWGASTGVEIMRRLTPVLAPALLAFKGIKGAGGLADIKEGELLDMTLEDLFTGITGDVAEPVSVALSTIANAVMLEGDAELLREILVHTHRVCGGESLLVGHKVAFDQAYMANYGELFVAIIQTLTVNYGGIFKRFAAKAAKKK